jgi:acyltransferase
MRGVTSRIDFIDVARILGIALMYYGHVIESLMKLGSDSAAFHYKFIYSFHMPLFFILSGYLASRQPGNESWTWFLKKNGYSRLIPYALFSILLLIPTFFIPSQSVGLDLSSSSGYIRGLFSTFIGGFPVFNIPTWFLICIFVVELFHYLCQRSVLKIISPLALCALMYVLGTVAAWYATWLNPLKLLSQREFIFPYLMVLEAFTGYAFYLFGLSLNSANYFGQFNRKNKQLGLLLLSLAIVYLTYDLNQGMFILAAYDAVIMVGSSHGNPILFPLTAIVGSLAVISVGLLLRRSKTLQFLGANTLVIFALNGVFYHFINDPLARLASPWIHNSDALTLCYGVIVTITSLLLTIPALILLNKYVPQLVGKPLKQGPIMRPLMDPSR